MNQQGLIVSSGIYWMKKRKSILAMIYARQEEREDSKRCYPPSRRVVLEDKCEFRYEVQSPMENKEEIKLASEEYHEYE